MLDENSTNIQFLTCTMNGTTATVVPYEDSTPDKVTEAGYRLYDERGLEKLQQILLFRELEFPLKEIRDIVDDCYEKAKAILIENSAALKAVAEALIVKEKLDQIEFERIFAEASGSAPETAQ